MNRPPNVLTHGGQVLDPDGCEQRHWIARAVAIAQQELECTPQAALAAICRDWMDKHQLPVSSPNPFSMAAQYAADEPAVEDYEHAEPEKVSFIQKFLRAL